MRIDKSEFKIEKKFSLVPNELWLCRSLSMTEKGIFAYLLSLYGGWAVSTRYLAKVTGLGKSTIARTLEKLQLYGLLRQEGDALKILPPDQWSKDLVFENSFAEVSHQEPEVSHQEPEVSHHKDDLSHHKDEVSHHRYTDNSSEKVGVPPQAQQETASRHETENQWAPGGTLHNIRNTILPTPVGVSDLESNSDSDSDSESTNLQSSLNDEIGQLIKNGEKKFWMDRVEPTVIAAFSLPEGSSLDPHTTAFAAARHFRNKDSKARAREKVVEWAEIGIDARQSTGQTTDVAASEAKRTELAAARAKAEAKATYDIVYGGFTEIS